MGKGGGGGPSQTTAYQTNLPEYARPYVENMLNAGQAQIYNSDMTGFKPYQPYSNNPTDYFAGPSSLQKSTYNEAGQMQTPEAFGPAQGLAGAAAMGSLGAGQNYANQFLNGGVQRYMNPYLNEALQPQLAEMRRQYGITGTQEMGNATKQGAFGGSREALMAAENARNMNTAMNQAIGQGYNTAFDKAVQAQQYGANLGLQGYGQALQGAGTLGQLAGSQQQADIARMGFQNQVGQQQQQYQQGIINQAIQDYATAQQYPFMQLGTMSNLLRGLPMQSMTTQQYQAAPNYLSQLGGLGATALGAYGAAGGFKAKGGAIKEKKMAIGGIASAMPESQVANSVESQLLRMELDELIKVAKTNPSKEIREEAARLAAKKQSDAQVAQSMGLEAAPAPNMDGMATLAGGGIIAFARGNLVPGEEDTGYPQLTEEEQAQIDKDPDLQKINLFNKYWSSKGIGQQSPEVKAIANSIAETKQNLQNGGYDDKNLWQSVMAGGIGAVKGKSQYGLQNIGEGLEAGLGQYMRGEARKEDLLNKLRSGEIDLAKLTNSERNNLMHYATTSATQSATTRARLAESSERGLAAAEARKSTSLDNLYRSAYDKLITGELKRRGLSFEKELSSEELDKFSREAAERAKREYGYLHGSATGNAGGADAASFDKKNPSKPS